LGLGQIRNERAAKHLIWEDGRLSRNSSRHASRRNSPNLCWIVSAILSLAIGGLTPTAGYAYTAAGDRSFPGTLILPQVGPSDALWVPLSTQTFEAVSTGDRTRATNFTGTYSKLITERLGAQFGYGLTHIDRLGTSSVTGAQNFHMLLQYETILDPANEFLMSVQLDREFGGTGDQGAGSAKQSATEPGLTFAKGLGDLPIGYWRPLAITGFTGYQIGEGARPNMVDAGFSVQYSIPYLVSKVTNVDLPSFVRGMTVMTEVMVNTPVGRSFGRHTMNLVAPGISYSEGNGWELAIEAMIPTTKATGSGVGVIAQLLLQLDYLLPDSVVGRPLFPPH
jgi:hypothetical protein